MKNRLEDLGRIRVLIENILEDDIWNLYGQRTKDFESWFKAQSSDEQGDLIHKIAYSISSYDTKLYEILAIAKGSDEEDQ
jgi:hypothetical protein